VCLEKGQSYTTAERTTPKDDLMTLREVCEYIRRHPNTVRRWIELKLFPPWECKDGPYPNSPLLFSRSKVYQRQADRIKKYPWPPPANDNNPPTANDNRPDAEQAVCPCCGKPI
jgi:hypothetical protein